MLFLEASLVLLAPESTLSVCLFLCVAGEAAIIESSLIFLFFIFYLLLKVNKHINFGAIYIQKAVVVEIKFFFLNFPFVKFVKIINYLSGPRR